MKNSIGNSRVGFAIKQKLEIEQSTISNSDTADIEPSSINDPSTDQKITIYFDPNIPNHIPEAEMFRFTKEGQMVHLTLFMTNTSDKTIEDCWNVKYNSQLKFTNEVIPESIEPGEKFSLIIVGYYSCNDLLQQVNDYTCSFNFQRDNKVNQLNKDFKFRLKVI